MSKGRVFGTENSPRWRFNMIVRFIKENLAEILLVIAGSYLRNIGVTMPQVIIVLVIDSLANCISSIDGERT